MTPHRPSRRPPARPSAPTEPQPAAWATERPEEERRALLRAALLDAYAEVLARPEPPDHVLSGFFRLHPEVRGSGRGFVAATCYALLRSRATAVWRLAAAEGRAAEAPTTASAPLPAPSPEREALVAFDAWLGSEGGPPPGDRDRWIRDALDAAIAAPRAPRAARGWPPADEARRLLDAARGADPLAVFPGEGDDDRAARLAAATGAPADLIAAWGSLWGWQEAEALVAALRRPAPLALRVETTLATREAALEQLAAAGIAARAASLAPEGILLERKVDLRDFALRAAGALEVQDEGSQLVAHALDPRPGWRVLDACAGGGGKTLHLASLLAGSGGEVVAADADPARMEELRRRLSVARLAGVAIVEVLPTPPEAFDAVLVDAPCLGLGTLRRRPHLAWSGGPLAARAAAMGEAQLALLQRAADLVRGGGGVLLYAVCSLHPAETTGVVRALLAARPDFALDQPGRLIGLLGESAPDASRVAADGGVFLTPHRHGTDGFFLARLTRR